MKARGKSAHLAKTEAAVSHVGRALLLSCAFLAADPSIFGQDSLWRELTAQVVQLLQQRKFTQALPVAQEALRIAEVTFGPEDPYFAASLANLADVYSYEGDYAAAEPVYERALAIDEKALGPDDPVVEIDLNRLAGLYMRLDRYSKAEPLLKRALAIGEKAVGTDAPLLVDSLNNLAKVYVREGKYEDALPLWKRVLVIDENALGPNHPTVAVDAGNLGELYQEEERYTEAEPLLQRALAILKGALPADDPKVATITNNVALLYHHEGKYEEAEALYKRALLVVENVPGSDDLLVAQVLNNMGGLYTDEGKFPQAEPLLKRALAIREKALGLGSLDVSQTLNNLARLYREQGKYAEAEGLLRNSLAIRETALGQNNPLVARLANNLGELYQDEGKYPQAEVLLKRGGSVGGLGAVYQAQGRYAEAERLFRQVLAIDEKALGGDHPDVASDLNDLAALYRETGKFYEAEMLNRRSLAILEKALGPEHPKVAQGLNNLGVLYEEEGRYSEAEPLFQRALDIREKALGPDHPDVANSLNNLAEIYQDDHRYAEAKSLLERTLAMVEKAFGPDHPNVAFPLGNLGELYRLDGKYATAEPLYKRALSIREKAVGPDHPDVETTVTNLALLQWNRQDALGSEAYFERGRRILFNSFEQQFAYMSENERLGYLAKVASYFPVYLSFCFTYRDQYPNLVGNMYDLLLWEKGMVVSSVAAQRARLAASGDAMALAALDKLTAKKNQLAALSRVQLSNRDQQWRQTVEQLQQDTNELEKELTRRSASLAEGKRLAQPGWQQVQEVLGKDEAAVEVVRFQFTDGKTSTGRANYVALVVRPGALQPKVIPLGESTVLEDAPMDDYRQRVQMKGLSAGDFGLDFYRAFWKPLEPELLGVKRVYISPDGVLNQVSWAAIPKDDGGLLIEKYDVNVVLSTKDLIRQKPVPADTSAVLIGNPQFDLSESEQQAAVASVQANAGLQSSCPDEGKQAPSTEPVDPSNRSTATREGLLVPLVPLTETQKELDSVSEVLRKNGWRVKTYCRQNALEEVVKHVSGPRVLHLATHGFFEPDQPPMLSKPTYNGAPVLEGSMLRSGLYFAGADRTRAEQPAAGGVENGVLTAYEATGLNLQGTELVILSACDTGLGQVASSEGVFGLHRALQEAGAQAVLMSMWSIPDEDTRKLMTMFYAKWLSGTEMHAALLDAQLALRAELQAQWGVDVPHFWAGFVLVGQ